MTPVFIAFFAVAFGATLLATLWVASFARRKEIVDKPDATRHFHKAPTPMLGGLAVFFGFVCATLGLGVIGGYFDNGNIPLNIFWGILAGGLILMVGGFLDDKYQLPAKYSILFAIAASLAIVIAGIRAVSLNNPFTGEVVLLDQIRVWGLPLLSGFVVFAWTMTLTYTTKLLDGMDGLVTGVSAIAALILFGLSLRESVAQPQTAMLAISLAGSLLGFLVFNFHPAKIFIGEAGSTFAGFMLAVLAIVSGGKIATTLLVMGIPLLDMAWVIFQRLRSGASPFSGDRRHLHYRLEEIGLSQRQTVLLLYGLSASFGIAGLFLQSKGKLVALLVLAAVMMGAVSWILIMYKRKAR